MIEIKIKNEPVDLPADFSIEIEDSSPVFNDRGSQSIPATIPATPKNCRLLGFPTRLDSGTDINGTNVKTEVIAGAYMRSGIMNITDAGKTEGITFNVGFGNSEAYMKWKDKKLPEISGLPTFIPDDSDRGGGYPIEWLMDDMYHLYVGADPQADDLAVFPVAINNESLGSGDSEKIYWEILNVPGNRGMEQPTHVNRIINGVETLVTVPAGYCVSPFLRVWRILELVFDDLGLRITQNPFRENLELARLVVLNNAADAACPGEIRYADLLPDCTIDEFLNALWVRFGLVYSINTDAGEVSLGLLRDILRSSHPEDIDRYRAGNEKISYNAAQYVTLSAKTSIEGAEPSHERFEDFSRGLDINNIHLGAHISEWLYKPDPENPSWDGDTQEYRSGSFLAREFVSGQWYKLDTENGIVKEASSGFFNWDPNSEGLSPLELSSEDECVPIRRVKNTGTGTGNVFNDHCPVYLVGSRHYHSFIKGSDSEEKNGDSTPLAFMFAYTTGHKTIGRLNAEDGDGQKIKLDDGSIPTLSLYFQFKDGLFANFWTDYDEILRHGNRTVELQSCFNKVELSQLDFLKVYRLNGIRCLIDTVGFSLPASKSVPVQLKLRTIQTQGTYDIKKEQNIPDFTAAARHLEWGLLEESYGDALDSVVNRTAAAVKYRTDNNYTDHGSLGDYWTIDRNSPELRSMERGFLTWMNDPDLPVPGWVGAINERKYSAILCYDIYEIHDMSTGPDEDDWERDEVPIGTVELIVEYKVKLVARWVNDDVL